jgi:hypothetical protein
MNEFLSAPPERGGPIGSKPHRARFATYNGLPNYRFHTLLFEVNRLRSDEVLHCCSEAFVQVLCNENFNGLPKFSQPSPGQFDRRIAAAGMNSANREANRGLRRRFSLSCSSILRGLSSAFRAYLT